MSDNPKLIDTFKEVKLPTLMTPPGSTQAAVVLYLNAGGGTLLGSYDDAPHGASSIVAAQGQAQATVPPFRGTTAQWQQLVTCVRQEFSRFHVTVTDHRPVEGPYTMVMFGGDGSALGYGAAVGGVAPLDSRGCTTITNAVVFVFTDNFGANLTGACEIAAQEISHTFSLDHEYLSADPMSYLFYSGHKVFQDREAPCGEFQMRPCVCGRPTQNSVAVLTDRLGIATQ